MVVTPTRIRERLSLLLFTLFLLNSLLPSSTGSTSPDGRYPIASPAPSQSLTPLVPPTSTNTKNDDDTKVPSAVSTGNVTTTDARGNEKNSSRTIPLWKQQLPFPLNNRTNTLRRIIFPGYRYNVNAEVEIFLLGTAHISKDSSRDVHQLLESVKPDAIFLELCHQRANMLEPNEEENIYSDQDDHEEVEDSNPELNSTVGFWDRCRSVLRISQTKKAKRRHKKRIDTQSFSSVASSLLSNMQDDYADALDAELGGEFRAAYHYWKSVHDKESYRRASSGYNVHLILGDRPVTLTLMRAWESLRFWGRIKLMVGLILSSLRKPKPDEIREWMEKVLYGDTDLMSESVTELAKHFPTLAEVILKERDAYMACKLHQSCRGLLMNSRYKVNRRFRLVAIVGAGHVEGICEWLTTGGSLATISTVAAAMASPSLSSSTTTTTTSTTTTGAAAADQTTDLSQERPETPEDILSKLIQIKATIAQEDHDYLVHQITQVDPEQMPEEDTSN